MVSASQAQTLLIPVPLAPPPASAALTTAGQAALQESPEPERWTKEDLTLDEQYSTARKEAMAAYQIAVDDCKLGDVSAQPDCLAKAKRDMETDMALIKARFGITD